MLLADHLELIGFNAFLQQTEKVVHFLFDGLDARVGGLSLRGVSAELADLQFLVEHRYLILYLVE